MTVATEPSTVAVVPMGKSAAALVNVKEAAYQPVKGRIVATTAVAGSAGHALMVGPALTRVNALSRNAAVIL